MKQIHLQEVGSTNVWAKENALDVNQDAIIFTDNQTSGYGRFGRDWQSPKGSNLAFSILLNPQHNMQTWPNCSQVIAVAIASFFADELGLKPTLKWPNDILFNNKKAVGILSESICLTDNSYRLIIGVGINVKEDKSIQKNIGKEVTSLELVGSNINALDLMQNLIPLLKSALIHYFDNGFANFAKVWRELGENTGRKIKFISGDNTTIGVIKSINDDGTLIMIDDDNTPHQISSGEIEYITSHIKE